MLESLYIAASGMHAQQMNVDVVSNNLANVNTTGFKKSRVDFEDLMYRNIARNNGLVGSTSSSYRIGLGAAIASTEKVFTAGDIKKTDGQLDLAIQGDGFFEVILPDGTRGYTRSGSFKLDEEGMLVTADGNKLSQSIQIPPDTTAILVGQNGEVSATVTGEVRPMNLGKIELATFQNPGGLNPLGNNLYLPTAQSGDAYVATPGERGAGKVMQGFIEASNVKLIEEMINLVIAQRAYEINSKVVQASDEMMSITNGLYR